MSGIVAARSQMLCVICGALDWQDAQKLCHAHVFFAKGIGSSKIKLLRSVHPPHLHEFCGTQEHPRCLSVAVHLPLTQGPLALLVQGVHEGERGIRCAGNTIRSGRRHGVKTLCVSIAALESLSATCVWHGAVHHSKPIRTITCCVGVARFSKMQVPVVGRQPEALPQPDLIFWLQNVAQRR